MCMDEHIGGRLPWQSLKDKKRLLLYVSHLQDPRQKANTLQDVLLVDPSEVECGIRWGLAEERVP